MGLWLSQNHEKSMQGGHRAPSTKERALHIFGAQCAPYISGNWELFVTVLHGPLVHP